MDSFSQHIKPLRPALDTILIPSFPPCSDTGASDGTDPGRVLGELVATIRPVLMAALPGRVVPDQLMRRPTRGAVRRRAASLTSQAGGL